MTTAGLHAELAARGVGDEAVHTLADTLVRASKLGHDLRADWRPGGEPHSGHRFDCKRCGAVIAWMPGTRKVHRGTAAMAPCAFLARQLAEATREAAR